MMNTLEDISLACCVSLCCLSAVGFVFVSTVLKRAGRGFGDLFDGEGGLFGMDFGNLLDLFTGGRR